MMRLLNSTRSFHRIIVALLGLAMLLGAVVLGAEPQPTSESAADREESRATVSNENQTCSADVGNFGLPVDIVTSITTPSVFPGCPADGSICFDGDLCRAQCRACGIELGACIWGLCRCLDT